MYRKAHPAALSRKFFKYFFCSTNGLIISVKLSRAYSRSATYPDDPLTCLSDAQVVRLRALIATSVAFSSSRS
jgi:hypothetical protein